jgi:phage terminase large subunit-like protein
MRQCCTPEGFRFFEGMLMLSEGQFEGTPFRLHPSQAFIIGSLFGWKRADGTRRFRRAFIEQGKGNGKSPMAGGIGLYGLTADREAGAQVYAAAAKKEQAGSRRHLRLFLSETADEARSDRARLRPGGRCIGLRGCCDQGCVRGRGAEGWLPAG